MIQVKIEKEVKQDNKIFWSFTGRQIACFGLVVILEVLFYLLVHPQKDALVFVGILLGVVAWYFGYHKKFGINMEYFIGKTVKALVLRNSSRKYRTKNRYISTVNASYMADRSADMADKRIKKELNRQEKARAKAKKQTKIKAYA